MSTQPSSGFREHRKQVVIETFCGFLFFAQYPEQKKHKNVAVPLDFVTQAINPGILSKPVKGKSLNGMEALLRAIQSYYQRRDDDFDSPGVVSLPGTDKEHLVFLDDTATLIVDAVRPDCVFNGNAWHIVHPVARLLIRKKGFSLRSEDEKAPQKWLAEMSGIDATVFGAGAVFADCLNRNWIYTGFSYEKAFERVMKWARGQTWLKALVKSVP